MDGLPADQTGYAHETVIIIGRVDAPDEQPREVESVVLRGVGGIPEQFVVEVATPDAQLPPPYTLERRRNVYSWGASGATEAILFLVSTGVADAVVSRGLDLLLERYKGWRAGADSPLTRDGALASAQQTILVMHKDLRADDLTVVGEEYRDGGIYSFELLAPGVRFAAQVERRGGLAYVTRLRTSRAGDQPGEEPASRRGSTPWTL